MFMLKGIIIQVVGVGNIFTNTPQRRKGMKRSDKEINRAIAELEKAHSMGAYRKDDKISALQKCLEMDEEEIEEKIDEFMESDYDLYAVYDWAINGRDNF